MCKCSICNSTYNLNEFENCNIRDIMLSKDMCFNCAFWQEKVDLANENTIVVDGYRYQCSLETEFKFLYNINFLYKR